MKLKTIALSKLRNMDSFGYHGEILELIGGQGPDFLKIREIYNQYMTNYTSLDVLLKKISSSPITKQIKETDHERDVRFSVFRNMVNDGLNHYSPEVKDAAYRLKLLLNEYKKINDCSYKTQTSMVTNLLQELNGPYKNDVALLRGKDHVDQLAELNNKVRELMEQRRNESNSKPKGDVRGVRALVDNCYKDINETIAAYMKIEKTSDYNNYVNLHNLIRDEYHKMVEMSKPRPLDPKEAARIEEIKGRIAELETQLGAEKESLDIYRKEIADLQKSADVHKKNIAALTKQINELKAEMKTKPKEEDEE